jgi:hypothetical protein
VKSHRRAEISPLPCRAAQPDGAYAFRSCIVIKKTANSEKFAQTQIGMGASLNSMAIKKPSAKLGCKAMQVFDSCVRATKNYFQVCGCKKG